MKSKKNKNSFSFEEALAKCASFCVYQERCKQEVYQKLKALNVAESDANRIVEYLIAENFLNEERFAEQFASGKFRVNRWGKLKIRAMLLQKDIDEVHIQKAISQIDNFEYQQVIQQLIQQKKRSLPLDMPKIQQKHRILQFLCSKGFENEIVVQHLQKEFD
ncbi:MAG: RecX family transcriptional regulator [Cytophagales bacterium]|nr:RecX family transcriptional regulator [Cytophagales bacterium]MDW8385101.1 regulatory protein RecX [Flammeovirgaceae bacterium]